MPKEKSDELSDLSSSASDSVSGSEEEPKPKKKKTESKTEKKDKSPKKDAGPMKGDNGEFMFELSSARFATVSEFRGKTFIGIREFYEKDGKRLPGKKGISLTPEQWKKLKDHMPQIDECVKNM